MMRFGPVIGWRVVATASAAASLLACSAILDLASPPEGTTNDGGGGNGGRDGSLGDANDLGDDGSSDVIDGSDGAVGATDAGFCALLDAGDGSTISSPFAQFTDSDGASSVEVFDVKGVLGLTSAYSGGVFDGQYVYFPPRGAGRASI
jgi:hypothetical protein